MFNNTKYTKWYFTIINNAEKQQRKKGMGIYYESHHIIPKSLEGDNSKRNRALLTAKEHYVCHLLLPKMCLNSKHKGKMVFALMNLSEAANTYRYPHRYTSRLYQRAKAHYIKHISGPNSYMFGVAKTPSIRAKISATKKAKGLSVGKNNPMYGKHHTKDTRQAMALSKQKMIVDGGETRRQIMITANPRSRPVRTPGGLLFPSLSAARRHYNLVSKASAIIRIARGEWQYV